MTHLHRLFGLFWFVYHCQASFLRVLQSGDSSKISLKQPVSLALNQVPIAGKYYDSSTFVIGASSQDSSKGASVDMIPDLATNTVMVGSFSSLDWGINCDDGSMGCTKVAGSEHTCRRLGSTSNCLNASTFLRFANGTSLPSAVGRLPIELLTTEDNWSTKRHGIFGIGPKSPVWSYFKNSYDNGKDHIDFSLFYRASKIDHMISVDDQNFKNAVFVVNGKGISIDPFFINYPKNSNSDSWIINSINFTKTSSSGKRVESNEKVCLANSVNATIAASDPSELIQVINQQLCGNKDGGCKLSNSNIGNVSGWTFTLYNESDKDSRFEIEVKPEELVNFDKDGKAVILIQDLGLYSSICSGATMAFGKYFLAAREVVIRYNKGTNTFDIGFHSFEPTLVFLIILLVLAGIIFSVFVIVCVYSLVSRARKHFGKEDYLHDDKLDNRELIKSGDIN
jgi:hypothetical protein